MFGRWFSRERILEHGEAARRLHSSWLTHALGIGVYGERVRAPAYPRIPVRRVDEGGWSELMSRPVGPMQAQRCWDEILEGMEHAEHPE
jgi:hypothetical protein